MKTRAQPLEQARFGMAQIDVGNADALKSEFSAPIDGSARPAQRGSGIATALEVCSIAWPAIIIRMQRFLATAEADTRAFGAALAPGVASGHGRFTSAATSAPAKPPWCAGLLRALGVRERVKSPTFTLVELYIVSRLYLYHFDFYRFSRSDEWVEAGFREYFNRDAVCLVEWPEKAGGQLPAPDLRIVMEVDGSGRSITVSADTEAGQDCLTRLHC